MRNYMSIEVVEITQSLKLSQASFLLKPKKLY